MQLQNPNDLESTLTEEVKQEKNSLDVLKELFLIKNIETKTELSIQQIILINQKRTLSKLIDFEELNDCLNDFMLLMVSNSRKGRTEFVDGFKSDRERENVNNGFLGNMREKMGLR